MFGGSGGEASASGSEDELRIECWTVCTALIQRSSAQRLRPLHLKFIDGAALYTVCFARAFARAASRVMDLTGAQQLYCDFDR